jgi:predicted metalloprotease with PDZ domain
VHSDSPAELAGIAPGDEAIAFNGRKLTSAGLDVTLRDHFPGDIVTISVFRRDEFMQFRITLAESPNDTCYLEVDNEAGIVAEQKRNAWLTAGASK